MIEIDKMKIIDAINNCEHLSQDDMLQMIDERINTVISESSCLVVPTYCEEKEEWLFKEDFAVYGGVEEVYKLISELNDIDCVCAHDNDEVEDYDDAEENLSMTLYLVIDLR